MPGILVSGPAGGGKSQRAIELLRSGSGPIIAADFQRIVVALLLLERDPTTGLYPIRPEWVLPLAEYTRQAVITGALSRGMDVIITNSDGAPARRKYLLDRLGVGAVEEIIDPGEDVVSARLSSPKTGKLKRECKQAISRWYRRK